MRKVSDGNMPTSAVKRRKPVNLKAKTREEWIKRGYRVANVEQCFNNIKFDCFGVADLLAFLPPDSNVSSGWPSRQVHLIQVGRWHDLSAKTKALEDNPVAREWVAAGHSIVLSLWNYTAKPGKQRRDFELREIHWP